MDSGATQSMSHVSQASSQLAATATRIIIATGARTGPVSKGKLVLRCRTTRGKRHTLRVPDTLFSPEIDVTLFSFGQLLELGYQPVLKRAEGYPRRSYRAPAQLSSSFAGAPGGERVVRSAGEGRAGGGGGTSGSPDTVSAGSLLDEQTLEDGAVLLAPEHASDLSPSGHQEFYMLALSTHASSPPTPRQASARDLWGG